MSASSREDKSELSQAKTRLAFRGDTRPPDILFKIGFVSRDPAGDIHYREKNADNDRSTAVSVSWRLRPTVYFPFLPRCELILMPTPIDTLHSAEFHDFKTHNDEDFETYNGGDFETYNGEPFEDKSFKDATPDPNNFDKFEGEFFDNPPDYLRDSVSQSQMSETSDSGPYEKSDLIHVYLYKGQSGKFFYINDEGHCYLDDGAPIPQKLVEDLNSEFVQVELEKKPLNTNNRDLINQVFATTHQQGSTLVSEPNPPKIWIYVVDIDLSQASQDTIFSSKANAIRGSNEAPVSQTHSTFFNTHGRQVLDSMTGNNSVRQLFFADEFAVKEIKPENILFAVPCIRTFNDLSDLSKGGTYELGPEILFNSENENIKNIPATRLDQIREFLESEIEYSRNREMTLTEMGYHLSQPKELPNQHESPEHETKAVSFHVPKDATDVVDANSVKKNIQEKNPEAANSDSFSSAEAKSHSRSRSSSR